MAQRAALMLVFESFMSCPPTVSKEQLGLLTKRLRSEQSTTMKSSEAHHINPPCSDTGTAAPSKESAWERKANRAILRLAEQFPDDSGVRSAGLKTASSEGESRPIVLVSPVARVASSLVREARLRGAG